MDWRTSLHDALKATEVNLARMQSGAGASSRPSAYNNAPAVGGAAYGYQAAPPPPPQPFVNVNTMQNMRDATRNLGAELDLERQVREDTMRELHRRQTNEVGELRELIRQLREENIDIRRSLTSLERRPTKGATSASFYSGETGSDGSPFSINGGGGGGGMGNNAHAAALLPRVSELETVVQKLQRTTEDRGSRLELGIQTAVNSRIELEMERLKSTAREAARDATDEYVKLRVESIQRIFSAQLQTAIEFSEKTTQDTQTLQQSIKLSQQDYAAKLKAIDEKAEAALEGRDRWMSVSTEVRDIVRMQLDAERVRMDETLRLLRLEVTSAAKRQTQDQVDSQHALQHFVNQRLETMATQFMSADDASRLLQSNTAQMEQETNSIRKLMAAYKTQFDEAHAENIKFLQQYESKWTDTKLQVEHLIAQRSADTQSLSRLRDTVETVQMKSRVAGERVEEMAIKVVDAATKVEQHRQHQSEWGHSMSNRVDDLTASLEGLRKTVAETSSTVSKLSVQGNTYAQMHEEAKLEMGSMAQLLTALQVSLRDVASLWKKQLAQSLEDVSRAMDEKMVTTITQAIDTEGMDMCKKIIAESTKQLQQLVSTSVGDVRDSLREEMEKQDRFQAKILSAQESTRKYFDQQISSSRSELKDFLGTEVRGGDDRLQREMVVLLREGTSKAKDEVTALMRENLEDVRRSVLEATKDMNQKSMEQLQAQLRNEVSRASLESSNALRLAMDEMRSISDGLDRRLAPRLDSFDSFAKAVDLKLEHLQRNVASLATTNTSTTTSSSKQEESLGSLSALEARLSAKRKEDDDVMLANLQQRMLVIVQGEIEKSQQWTKKRLSETQQTMSESYAMLRRSVNDMDERVTSIVVTTAGGGSSGSQPSSPNRGIEANSNALVAQHMTALKRLVDDVDQKTSSRFSSVNDQLASFAETVKQMQEDQDGLQQQLYDVLSEMQRTTKATPAATTATLQGQQDVDQRSAVLFEALERRVVEAIQAMGEELDAQTEKSLQCLDDKVNLLAETLSRRDEVEKGYMRQAVQSCVSALRDSSGSSDSSSSLMLHSSSPENRSNNNNNNTLRSADDVASNGAGSEVEFFFSLLTNKVVQCNDALHTISASVLDTVDLVQRHEAGFSSITELVQAIMFNSQNIVTLAEAIGLEKDAFTLKLNFPEGVMVEDGGEASSQKQ